MRPPQEGAGGRGWRAQAVGWGRAAAEEEAGGRPLRRSAPAAAERPIGRLKAAEGESSGDSSDGGDSDDGWSPPGTEGAGSGAEEEVAGAGGRGKGCPEGAAAASGEGGGPQPGKRRALVLSSSSFVLLSSPHLLSWEDEFGINSGVSVCAEASGTKAHRGLFFFFSVWGKAPLSSQRQLFGANLDVQ